MNLNCVLGQLTSRQNFGSSGVDFGKKKKSGVARERVKLKVSGPEATRHKWSPDWYDQNSLLA
jgi:hypothetical protein